MTTEDMQARLAASEDIEREAGARTDPLRSAIDAPTLEEAIERMKSDGIVEEDGDSIVYWLQRGLGPMNPRADGSVPADPYEGVDRIKFPRRLTGAHMRSSLRRGDWGRTSEDGTPLPVSTNALTHSWIIAFSNATAGLVDRLDADDWEGAGHVAHAVHEGNFKSSIVTGRP